jgi:D-glycero-alpha-D-manno-heptose-7-phosphate kinase
MIISRTPFRISFFGGGTDYPAWYKQHGGAVVATTINKYCYLTCRYLPPFFEHRFRVVWSCIERCQTVDEITHPAIRAALTFMNIDRGVEIHHDGDVPARSGMGSSSAFTVGLLHALHALQGNMPSKHQLVKESLHVEQDLLRETVGSQDQVLAAYGGLNHVTFLPDGEICVRPITVPAERLRQLNAHLMLFYTGVQRTASSVADSYVNHIGERKRELRIMREFVDESLVILSGRHDISAFGELLHEAWQAKRGLSAQVSNSQIDALYEHARSMGAAGGKIVGAGGGGFLLLFVPPPMQARLLDALADLIHVPFRFDTSGSQIIFYDPQEDFADLEQRRSQQTIQAFRELQPEHKSDDELPTTAAVGASGVKINAAS